MIPVLTPEDHRSLLQLNVQVECSECIVYQKYIHFLATNLLIILTLLQTILKNLEGK